jgi:carbamoyl-phosphate synthase large subunit
MYRRDFQHFLGLMKYVVFEDLQFQRIHGETWDIRPLHVAILEDQGFQCEGRLRRHCLINGKPTDALMHGYTIEDWTLAKNRSIVQGVSANEVMKLYTRMTGWKPAMEIKEGIHLLTEYEREQNGKVAIPSGNILISSSSAKVPLLNAVKRAASKLGLEAQIIAGDSNKECLSQYFCDQFWEMPPLAELEDESGLLRELRARRVSFIIPTRDGELPFWSLKRDVLARNGIQVMVSNPASVERCLDKLEFCKHCRRLGVPAILTAESLDELPPVEKYVVKERFGAGSRQLGLCLSRADALRHAESLRHPIFQPHVQGDEYSVDSYVERNGNVKGIICRRRDVLQNGESQVTTTVRDSRLEQACRSSIEALNLYGHVLLQIFQDELAEIHLIECNARFGGASTLSLAAGLDSFFWFFLEASGSDISAAPFTPSAGKLRQVRVPQDCIFTAE